MTVLPRAVLILASVITVGPATAAAIGSAPAAAPVQTPRETPDGLPSPDRATAYLVTVGPGDAVWERFGHNLLWIHDPETPEDAGYNYGLFSFEQENFILRFVRGRMDYWMAGLAIRDQLAAYRAQRRSIWIQELGLGPDRVRELQAFLRWNERPENRTYRYHYYRDNCSTRVRDALDRVLDGRLRRWAERRRPAGSYREHTLRLTADLFPIAAGMHFGLGPSVDRPLTAWEAMFIPMEMQRHLRSFPAGDGETGHGAFVRDEWTYHHAERASAPETAPRWTGGFLAAGVLLAGLLAVLGHRTGRRRAAGSGALLAVGLPWLIWVGLWGSVVVFLWGFTDHVDTRMNLNLFQASPLHLVLGFVLWPALRGRRRWALRTGPWLAAGIAVLSVAGPLVEILTPVRQVNAEFVALLLPVNVALAWALHRATPDPEAPE